MTLSVRFAPVLALAVGLAISASAWAAPATWVVDKAASKLAFRSGYSGEPFEGRFGRWDAQIQFDPAQLAASKAVVTVDIASATTGDGTKDEYLPSDDWFSTRKFPTATFATRAIKSLGGNRYQAEGDLTLKGVSRPVTLPFTLAINGDVARMNGQVSLNRTVFGVGQGEFKSAETVPFDVVVVVDLTARRKP